ncbi:hypothetical protein C8Q75DRAFT_498940 [Abortiporus biennis]|nr:hypothetical protein C8Q75DRAFT_498940 [Abortiporus biennis]
MCSADNDESMDVEDTLRVPVLVSQKGDSPKPDLAGMAPEDKDIGKSTQTTPQTDVMSSNAYPKRSPSDPFSPSVNTGPTVESDVQEVLVWDDPDAEERSMELATPLQPTIILSSTNTRDWLSSVGISDSTPPDSSHENDRRTNHDHDQHLEPPTAAHILESSTNDHHHLPAVVDPVDIPLPDSDSPSPTIPGPLSSNTHIYTPTLSFAPPSTDRRESDAVVPDIVNTWDTFSEHAVFIINFSKRHFATTKNRKFGERTVGSARRDIEEKHGISGVESYGSWCTTRVS